MFFEHAVALQLSFHGQHHTGRLLRIMKEVLQEKPGAPELPAVRGDVVFDNVSFGYEVTHPALRHLSFSAKAGSIIALVEQGSYAELVARGGLFAELDASGRFMPDAEDPTDSYAEPTLTAF
ncbi:MAG: hypothetical protein ACREO6_05345 [Rudaea sp.]